MWFEGSGLMGMHFLLQIAFSSKFPIKKKKKKLQSCFCFLSFEEPSDFLLEVNEQGEKKGPAWKAR